MITGGDVAKAAKRLHPAAWQQSYKELSTLWKSVNMYSDPAKLKHASWLIVLPTKDELIDPDDVRKERLLQNAIGNNMQVLERHRFGHMGTIIEEIILFPKRILSYIKMVE